ncbi:Next to BRCA1 protein 1 protein [Dimargaris cristalligena]|nr:Next to BRCA1 protein 1 protein [Dimargaris cristalligena]
MGHPITIKFQYNNQLRRSSFDDAHDLNFYDLAFLIQDLFGITDPLTLIYYNRKQQVRVVENQHSLEHAVLDAIYQTVKYGSEDARIRLKFVILTSTHLQDSQSRAGGLGGAHHPRPRRRQDRGGAGRSNPNHDPMTASQLRIQGLDPSADPPPNNSSPGASDTQPPPESEGQSPSPAESLATTVPLSPIPIDGTQIVRVYPDHPPAVSQGGGTFSPVTDPRVCHSHHGDCLMCPAHQHESAKAAIAPETQETIDHLKLELRTLNQNVHEIASVLRYFMFGHAEAENKANFWYPEPTSRPKDDPESQVVLCSECRAVILGRQWGCPDCPAWIICTLCSRSTVGHNHPHPLHQIGESVNLSSSDLSSLGHLGPSGLARPAMGSPLPPTSGSPHTLKSAVKAADKPKDDRLVRVMSPHGDDVIVVPRLEDVVSDRPSASSVYSVSLSDPIPPERQSESVIHHGIYCDNCKREVRGVRYKCASCPDFNLCAACERYEVHNPQHVFLKLKQHMVDLFGHMGDSNSSLLSLQPSMDGAMVGSSGVGAAGGGSYGHFPSSIVSEGLVSANTTPPRSNGGSIPPFLPPMPVGVTSQSRLNGGNGYASGSASMSNSTPMSMSMPMPMPTSSPAVSSPVGAPAANYNRPSSNGPSPQITPPSSQSSSNATAIPHLMSSYGSNDSGRLAHSKEHLAPPNLPPPPALPPYQPELPPLPAVPGVPLRATWMPGGSVPDGTIFAPQTVISKTWIVSNTGPGPWPVSTTLVPLDNYSDLQPTQDEYIIGGADPHQAVPITVTMYAPERPGTYTTYWSLMGWGEKRFGDTLRSTIVVQDPRYPQTPPRRNYSHGHLAPLSPLAGANSCDMFAQTSPHYNSDPALPGPFGSTSFIQPLPAVASFAGHPQGLPTMPSPPRNPRPVNHSLLLSPIHSPMPPLPQSQPQSQSRPRPFLPPPPSLPSSRPVLFGHGSASALPPVLPPLPPSALYRSYTAPDLTHITSSNGPQPLFPPHSAGSGSPPPPLPPLPLHLRRPSGPPYHTHPSSSISNGGPAFGGGNGMCGPMDGGDIEFIKMPNAEDAIASMRDQMRHNQPGIATAVMSDSFPSASAGVPPLMIPPPLPPPPLPQSRPLLVSMTDPTPQLGEYNDNDHYDDHDDIIDPTILSLVMNMPSPHFGATDNGPPPLPHHSDQPVAGVPVSEAMTTSIGPSPLSDSQEDIIPPDSNSLLSDISEDILLTSDLLSLHMVSYTGPPDQLPPGGALFPSGYSYNVSRESLLPSRASNSSGSGPGQGGGGDKPPLHHEDFSFSSTRTPGFGTPVIAPPPLPPPPPSHLHSMRSATGA